MEQLLAFLDRFGYLALFGVGLFEYAGLPVVSVPVLVAAGGLGSAAGLSPAGTVGAAAAGAWAADAGWYSLARWRGHRLVDTACALTSNPNACVLAVKNRFEALGAAYLLPAKFLPGVGNLAAPAAGLARVPVGRFLFFDAGGALLWAGGYTAVGWAFGGQVRTAVEWSVDSRRWVILASALLVLAAAAWRWVRKQRHGERHPTAVASPEARSRPGAPAAHDEPSAPVPEGRRDA